MTRRIRIEPRFESWQAAARALLREAVPPEAVEWLEGEPVEPLAVPAWARRDRSWTVRWARWGCAVTSST